MNTLAEGLDLHISDGTVTEATATRGQDAVRAQFASSPAAVTSGNWPSSTETLRCRTGLVFHDMLYDENVGSHIAWRTGYPVNVDGAVTMTPGARPGRPEPVPHPRRHRHRQPRHRNRRHRPRRHTTTPITRVDTFVLTDA